MSGLIDDPTQEVVEVMDLDTNSMGVLHGAGYFYIHSKSKGYHQLNLIFFSKTGDFLYLT